MEWIVGERYYPEFKDRSIQGIATESRLKNKCETWTLEKIDNDKYFFVPSNGQVFYFMTFDPSQNFSK